MNGAGLAMATMDAIKLYGAEPANFLDVGGRVNESSLLAAFELILGDRKVRRRVAGIYEGVVLFSFAECARNSSEYLCWHHRLHHDHTRNGLRLLALSPTRTRRRASRGQQRRCGVETLILPPS